MIRLFQQTSRGRVKTSRTGRPAALGGGPSWAWVERLEERVAPAGLVNGDFGISNPADPGFGWTTQGNAVVVNA
jgi:hypothetical protein